MPKLVTRCTIYDVRSLQNSDWAHILVHIYPLLYINLHVKHGCNVMRTKS